VEVDASGNRLPKMIRKAEQDKVPVVGIIGERERDGNEASVRLRKRGEVGAVGSDQLLESLQTAIANGQELWEMEGFEVKPAAPQSE
jgi:threonyl-tRNA synthetase